ncbi:MAG TPA: GAF domain-containing protein [Roseiflexaceae bacterium]|nr:GAF domain-containing protein [Roseiflexaceae bacterium]
MHSIMTMFLCISAGVVGYAGVTHLLIGISRRPRDATHLLFGLACLAIAVHTLVVLALHTAAGVDDYVLILKYAFGPSSVTAILLLMWFVASYTGEQPARFLYGMSVWFLLLLILHLVLPFGVLYAEISGLRPIRLPWGEQIVIARGTLHPLQLVLQSFYLVLFAFFGVALVRLYRSGHRSRALSLCLALAPLLVTRMIDPFVVVGLLDLPITSQFAFLSLVPVMSLVLSHGVTQTEIALQTYQQQLHSLVAARTAALAHTNDLLTREVRERTQLDLVLQRRVAELTALKQVADIGIRMPDLTTALQTMSQITTSLFAAHSTLLLIPPQQPAERHMLIGFERARGALGPEPVDGILAELPLASQVLAQGQSLLIPELQARSLPPRIAAFVIEQRLHTSMLIPLAMPGNLVGVMVVATDEAGRTFTSDEQDLAETIAGDMGAAITNTRLYQDAVVARERLTLLYQASQAIGQASLDPERIYAELHQAVARLMPTEAFVVILIDEAKHQADDVYLVDKDGRWPGKQYPLAGSFAGYMLARNRSVRIDDFSTFPQQEFTFELFGSLPDTEAGVAALLRGSQRVIGLVFVQSYTKGAYSEQDEEALQLLAAHTTVALEHAQRYHQARELAATAERARLARDLHDAVTQTLYSASLLAEALPTIWRRNAAAGERDLDVLRQLVRGALAEMRTLLFELRPAALVAANLGTLLRQLADRLTGNSHVPVTLVIDGDEPVPADLKIAVYRIVQEAFNNIAKHANATQVWVTLRLERDQGFLSVRDDGRGFDPNSVAGGLGLRFMAERAAAFNARLCVESAPRRGTEVTLSWAP